MGPAEQVPGSPATFGASPRGCTLWNQRQPLPPAPHHTHSTGHTTDHYRHWKATEGPYLVPALRHSDTAMVEPTAPCKTRPRSLTLDTAHEVIRALGLKCRGGEPSQKDVDTDWDLELIPNAPAGSAPARPRPPAGSVQALCPA